MSCPFQGSPQAVVAESERRAAAAAAAASSNENEEEEEIKQVIADDGVYYGDYLGLEKLLSAQHPMSLQCGEKKEAHDEMLFIVVHQVYELWFKQMLHELNSIVALFRYDEVSSKELCTSVHRLKRVVEIQRILIAQIQILETMHPMDFLEFRHLLTPASGFQSFQFRMFENTLGVQRHQRFKFQKAPYLGFFKSGHQRALVESERTSLFDLIERWLERTPFLEFEGWTFVDEYRKAVVRMNEADRDIVNAALHLSDAQRAAQLAQIAATEEQFDSLFDEERHNEFIKQGRRRLSYRATQAALLISLYRDEPMLQMPYQLLSMLIEVDENVTLWRYRHTMMVHRMLGNKMGTGGSSGYRYLKSTASDRYKVFLDLFNLASFFVPRSSLPPLPTAACQALDFYFREEERKAADHVHSSDSLSSLAAAADAHAVAAEKAAATAAASNDNQCPVPVSAVSSVEALHHPSPLRE
jgi:tryptophan 2,3-dioxygenase